MEVEIDSADGTGSVVLAQNHRNLFIQSDSVPELGSPILISFNGFVQKRDQGCLKVFRGFIDAYDVSIIRL